MYKRQDQNFKAIEYFEKSLQLYHGIGDRKEEGGIYNCLGAVYANIGQSEKAVECFENELGICKETGNSEGAVTCYNNLGGIYYYKRQYENAISHVEKGLELAEETGYVKGQKDSFSNLGTILIERGQYKRGIDCCKKSLNMMKETGDKQNEEKLYNHLGQAYSALGLHDKAIKNSEKALQANGTAGDGREKFNSFYNLGRAYRALGNCKMAAEYYEKAASVSKENKQSKNEACCYSDLGGVYQDMGQYEKAIEYHEKALMIDEEKGYKNDLAKCYNNLGSVYSALGLYEKSIAYDNCALQLYKPAKDTKGEMTCLINLGAKFNGLGQYEESIECLEKGLEISKAIGDKEGETTSYINLSTVYTALGQDDKSMELLKKALASANNTKQQAAICANIGEIAQSQLKYEEAIRYQERALEMMKDCGLEDEKRVTVLSQLGVSYALAAANTPGDNFEKARHYFLESIASHDNIREDLKDEYKIMVDNQNIAQYEALALILARLQEVDGALSIAERGRARALEDLMSKRYNIQKHYDLHALRLDEFSCVWTKQGSSFIFLAVLLVKLFSFVTKPGKVIGKPHVLTRECSTNHSDDVLQELVMAICKSSHFRQQGECEDRSLSSLYATESQALEQKNVEAMRHLRSKDEYREEESDLEANLSSLYKMIISPVADLLEDPEIVICPEGHMFRIPFAALKDANGRYLAENFRIRLIPSMTTLKLIYDCPADFHSQTGALIVGDPKVGRVKLDGKVTQFPPLPNARSEVKTIARLLGVPPLVGEQASKKEVLMRIQEVGLVHIAAHGDSERGEIAFAPNRSCHGIPKEDDFLLTMADIARVGIRAKLVVLSCCHSGCGKILKAEGVVGIARAFLGSGARSVLVSLWAVDDEATKVFMLMFYEFLLRDKQSASKALHLSMQKMRESPMYSDVVYWAPFVLIGDDVTLDL